MSVRAILLANIIMQQIIKCCLRQALESLNGLQYIHKYRYSYKCVDSAVPQEGV